MLCLCVGTLKNRELQVDIFGSFLELLGFEMKLSKNKFITSINSQAYNYSISGKLNKNAKKLISQNFITVEKILQSYQNNDPSDMLLHGKNMFEAILSKLKIDPEKARDNKNGIESHASGIYDEKFAVFTLQQVLLEDRETSLGMFLIWDWFIQLCF